MRWMAALLAAGSVCGQDAQLPADSASFKLESGVEVRIERVPDTRSMGLFVFVRTGFRDDPNGQTGLAHLTEHMVMSAASGVRAETWSYPRWNKERTVANAMTRPTWTMLWCIGTREQLSDDARHWAEVVAGKARFTEAQFVIEQRAMLRETINMTKGMPGGVLQWRARQLAFGGQPRGRQGIGIQAEVEALRPKDVQAFYRTHYRPDRTLVVAVGHVDPVKDRPFYEKVFGSLKLPKGAIPAPAVPTDKPPRPVTPHGRIGAPFASFAFRAPAPTSDEFPAFLVASLFLCSRANREFQLRGFEGVGFFRPGSYPLLEDPSLVFLNRRAQAGQKLADVREEVTAWLEKIRKTPIAEPHLKFPRVEIENLLDPLPRSRRRARLLAMQPRMLYRVGLARGAAAMWGFPTDLWQKVQAVRPEQVSALIRGRFRPKEAVFVGLTPESK